MESIAFPNCLQ